MAGTIAGVIGVTIGIICFFKEDLEMGTGPGSVPGEEDDAVGAVVPVDAAAAADGEKNENGEKDLVAVLAVAAAAAVVAVAVAAAVAASSTAWRFVVITVSIDLVAAACTVSKFRSEIPSDSKSTSNVKFLE